MQGIWVDYVNSVLIPGDTQKVSAPSHTKKHLEMTQSFNHFQMSWLQATYTTEKYSK